jgi:hypothetical protein
MTSTNTYASAGRPDRALPGKRRIWRAAMLGPAALSLLAVATLVASAAAQAAATHPHPATCAGCMLPAPTPPGARPAVPGIAAAYSYNWSGYQQTTGTRGTYTAVRDYWTVPTVNTAPSGDQYSSDWVGIGGATDSSLVQDGTEADHIGGTAHYDAWTEILPAGEVVITGLAIHPGDKIEGLVQETSAGTWQLTVYDLTTGQHGGRTVTYSSSGLSAEAIHERPLAGGGLSVLAATTNVTFEPGAYTTSAPGTQSWQPLLSPAAGATVDEDFMVSNSGTTVIAAPSAGDPYHDGFRVADGATSPPAPPEAAQLVFDDYIGTVYSIRVDGTNPNGRSQDACFTTPKTVDLIPGWWWSAGTKIWAYTSGNCTTGKLGISMNLTDTATVPSYHCQEDVSPYRDWNPGSNWENCAIKPSPNGVWYGYATGSFVRNM